jgi:hypothetical protein
VLWFVALGSHRLFSTWQRNPAPMDGGFTMTFTAGVLAGLGILALIAGLCVLAWTLGKRMAPHAPIAPPAAPEPPQIGPLHEDPLPTGEAARDFWLSLHASPAWKTLSHVYQADTRNYLREAKDAAEKGNQAGALFFLGKAHEAAFNAVKPQAQVQRATRAILEAARLKAEQATDAVSTGGRPADRWHPKAEKAEQPAG